MKFLISNLLISAILLVLSYQFIAPSVLAQQTAQSNSVITRVGNAPEDQKPSTGSKGDFVYYCQATSGDPKSTDRHYGWALCGPTSTAMIMSSLGVKKTPVEIDEIFIQNKWRAGGDAGMNCMPCAITSPWFKSQGFEALQVSVPLNVKFVKENYIDKGYYILGSVQPHIFVIDDVNPTNGTIHMRDPNKTCDPAGYWTNNSTPWTGTSGTSFPWTYAYAIKKI